MGLIDELKKTATLDGEELDAALLAIKEKYNSSADKEVIRNYLIGECQELKADLLQVNADLKSLVIKEQLKDSYEILPISYIAKKYFNKSAAWLYQRINGTKVRGHIYTLNEKEKSIFNDALQDIAKQIGSLSIG